jgi:hypothetical protein
LGMGKAGGGKDGSFAPFVNRVLEAFMDINP